MVYRDVLNRHCQLTSSEVQVYVIIPARAGLHLGGGRYSPPLSLCPPTLKEDFLNEIL